MDYNAIVIQRNVDNVLQQTQLGKLTNVIFIIACDFFSDFISNLVKSFRPKVGRVCGS